jgi:hypothetical protein
MIAYMEIDMKSILANFKISAFIGFLFTLPFIILELFNRWEYYQFFPLHIFAILWLLSTVFCLSLVSIVRKLKVLTCFRFCV